MDLEEHGFWREREIREMDILKDVFQKIMKREIEEEDEGVRERVVKEQ